MKVVGNYAQGWKGFAFKVTVASELQTLDSVPFSSVMH
jgi:hypothetical protein